MTPAEACNTDPWEAAYLRFETPEEEIAKFTKRLLELGAGRWPRDARIVELFCGRGNGMRALTGLGFRDVEGVDLSPRLLAQYVGPGKTHCCDCRELPFEDASRDIAIVQGGLHHLAVLPSDLERTFAEISRILKPGGLFVAVEPWLTPFLRFVHAVSSNGMARKAWGKLDALWVMILHERQTYEQWLGKPEPILALFHRYFEAQRCSPAWGKLMFVGKKRAR